MYARYSVGATLHFVALQFDMLFCLASYFDMQCVNVCDMEYHNIIKTQTISDMEAMDSFLFEMSVTLLGLNEVPLHLYKSPAK